jgi:hypothetical protein
MSGEGTAVDVPSALASLKRRGSCLLVAGAVPAESYLRASSWLLGEPTADPPRRRVVAVPESAESTAPSRLESSGPVDADHAGIVACNGRCRGTASGSAAVGRPSPGCPSGDRPGTAGRNDGRGPIGVRPADGGVPIRRVDTAPGPLGTAVDAELRRLAAVGTAAPGQLRVAFDPLADVLDAAGTGAGFALCHVLATRIRQFDGIGHVRLLRPRTDRTVRTLRPLFDAVVELRLDGESLTHRWHLRESGLTSDWLPIE